MDTLRRGGPMTAMTADPRTNWFGSIGGGGGGRSRLGFGRSGWLSSKHFQHRADALALCACRLPHL